MEIDINTKSKNYQQYNVKLFSAIEYLTKQKDIIKTQSDSLVKKLSLLSGFVETHDQSTA